MVKFRISEGTASSEQSSGLDFARKQLEKHGWSEGKGLGKAESGRANAIKVGVKNNTLGVGFDVGKEFTNHWWDNLFNKAANNIVVEQSKNGVQVSKKKADDDKTRAKTICKVKGKDLYYGRFVKANDEESLASSSEKSNVTTKFSDEELLKACGGRTAHKSARHGHKLSGKLKRVAEQDDDNKHPDKPSKRRKKLPKENVSSTLYLIDEKRNQDGRSEDIKEQTSAESETVQSKHSDAKRQYNTEDDGLKKEFRTSECNESEDKSVEREKRKKKGKKLAERQKYKQECEFVNASDGERKGDDCDLRGASDCRGANLMKEVKFGKSSVKSKKSKKKKKKTENGLHINGHKIL